MDIHSLMNEFVQLEGAEVGRGPRHPTTPNLSLAGEIDGFLNKYPFLRKDQGYVDFLECYAGARMVRPNNDLVIDVFGFTDISTHIVEQDGPIVGTRGFLAICDGMVRVTPDDFREGMIGQGFAYDAMGNRKWGIYRYVSEHGIETAMYWYCETFLEAFGALIATRGRLPDTLS